MPLVCPVCKAENSAGPNCRRCKADLGMLFALAEHRAALLAAVPDAIHRERLRQAWRLAVAANEQRQDAESLRWSAMLHMIHGNFGEAWRFYRVLNPHA